MRSSEPNAMPSGRIDAIHVAPGAGARMESRNRACVIEGVGIEGDRYAAGSGYWSNGGGRGRALTLVEAEVIESLATEHGIVLEPGATRRNLTTRGIRLNDLVGHEFTIGGVRCRAMRLAEPCKYLEQMLGRDVLVPLVHRAGIRADVLEGGEIAVGDTIARVADTAVVFDLGGVLLEWNPRYLYRKLFAGDEEAMEWFLANVCNPEWNATLDRGDSWDDAIGSLVARHPEHADLIRAYRERFREMLAGAISANVEIMDELRGRGTPLYALTNWSQETFDQSRPDFPFLEWFDGIVLSGRERLAKPDERIFRILLDRFGLEASRTVFIDDLAANVDSACRLGIDAIQFRDTEGLRSELERRSLLG